MANFVIKKDGSKEPFEVEKIKNSIKAAARETNLSEERVKEVVEQVSTRTMEITEGREEIPTREIRGKVLKELDIIEPSISEAWRRYDQEKGKI